MSNKNGRTTNFKLGTFHGTLTPVDQSKEAKLRNALYLIGNLKVKFTQERKTKIRIIGYEIPIEYRGQRIDLIGYDNESGEKNLWIIELKTHDSSEKISEIIDQINGYEKVLKNHIKDIENEFKEKFFLDVDFSGIIKKMILAPREFYDNHKSENLSNKDDVLFCSISMIREVFTQRQTENHEKIFELTLDSKMHEYDEIILKVENK